MSPERQPMAVQYYCQLASSVSRDQYTELHYIYTFWYNFDTVLCQFLKTGTSDRCLNLLGIVQLLKFSGFSLYPFHFSFTVPLNQFIGD